MPQQRRRFKHTKTFEERLAEDAKIARDKARSLPPGKEREELIRRVRRDEAAAQICEWLRSPDLQPNQDE